MKISIVFFLGKECVCVCISYLVLIPKFTEAEFVQYC